MTFRRQIVVIALCAALAACGAPAPEEARETTAAPQPVDAPLVLLISVDQMRADYLERFDAQFTGGLRRLLDEGAVFTEARQAHAITSTAPGHAAMLSGTYPRTNGIVDNTWYDHALGRRVGAVFDPDYWAVGLDDAEPSPGGAPTRFVGSSLAGWLKQRDARTQVVSISRKDRTAVLTAPEAEHAYWWHSSGRFVTSSYYRAELPDWVVAFNQRDWLAPYAGASWELLLSEGDYAASRPDDYPGEGGGRSFGRVFPHPLPEERRALGSLIQTTPFMDEATLGLGRAAITALNLGADEITDVLVLGLSSTDSIGHSFGPHSREVHDQMLRVDRMLGDFFDFLDETIGLDRTLIVLTSDHGVVRLPEYSRELGEDAERLRLGEIIAGIDEYLAAELDLGAGIDPDEPPANERGDERWFASYSYGWLQLDRERAAALGADPDALIARAKEYIETLDAVAAVFTRDELLSDRPRDSPFEESARRSFYPDRAGDLYLIHPPLSLWQIGSAANHQSPHDYDQRVPLILSHPAITSGERTAPAAVVDIGPTLAALLGVTAPEGLDGSLLPGF